MMFDKAAFFAATKPQVESINIDGVGALNLKQLNVDEVHQARQDHKKSGNPDNDFGLKLVIISAIDDNSNPVFNDADLEQLKKSSNKVVEAITEKTMEINGFLKTDIEKKEPTTSGGSATALPLPSENQ